MFEASSVLPKTKSSLGIQRFRQTMQKMLKQDLLLTRGKYKKSINKRQKIRQKITSGPPALTANAYNFSIDDGGENKKAKDTKKVCHKTKP